MTKLFNINGLAFFEHPKYGDEGALIVKAGGKFYLTDCYDRPDHDEALDIKACALRGDYSEFDPISYKISINF